MNLKIRKVNKFLEEQNTHTLTFEGLEVESLEDLELSALVYECIRLTAHHASMNSGKFETGFGKWRSVIDIWRHVKFFKPEITIFQVMSSIFEMNTRLVGHYCPTIDRRVFKVKIIHPDWSFGDRGYPDEFGLKFPDWKNLESLPKEEEISVKK